jgi:L-2-hydroxyglutarate oxidase LhgO
MSSSFFSWIFRSSSYIYNSIMSEHIQTVVIGAGVVGLAITRKLAMSGREVILLESEDAIGTATSSRNSEVIHAGIYYPENSLKAALCVRGREMLYAHCQQFAVPHKQCGKVIVAAHESQRDIVAGYQAQARRNGVDDLYWISQDELSELEPEVVGVGGVVSPSTGIVDSHAYMLSLQGIIEKHGGLVALNTKVLSIQSGGQLAGQKSIVRTEDLDIAGQWVINCAGLWAPQLAADTPGGPTAYYAKGHYYSYSGAQPFSRLVYPTAEAGGLGVHVTLDLAGQVKFGPDVRWIDDVDYSFDESHKQDFVAAIQAYFPNLDPERLHPSYTGIRPKISGPGIAAADFMLHTPVQHGIAGRINLLGIESPGLTASLAIAEQVDKVVRG